MKKNELADIDDIIPKSLQGNISEEEEQALKSWLNSSEKNQKLYQNLKVFWRSKHQESRYINAAALKERIISGGLNPHHSHSSRISVFLKVAAVLAIIISISFLIHDQISVKVNETELVETNIEKYNPSGVKSRIVLTDGSVVWLNAESKLSYKKGFSLSERFIELEGEAYFEVTKDQNRPFIVKTGEVYTQAIGTSFNIRYYPEEPETGVSLLTGKVSVKTSGKDEDGIYYLNPNEKLNISRDLQAISKHNISHDDMALWKDNILKFNHASFDNVIKTLERWYGVKIDVTQYNLRDWKYVGEFPNLSLEQVLSRIGYAQSFDYEINGEEIRIFNKTTN